MSSNITLQTTIGIASRFIYNSPLLYVNNGDLAYYIGDWTRQFMLAPPFAWRWNRGQIAPIVLSAGQSDYSINIPDFGWIEKATVIYPPPEGRQTLTISKELEVHMVLVGEVALGQPAFISPVFDDNNGNITFRLQPAPDNPYTLNIVYQKAAPKFDATTDTWAPIPDYYSYIYTQGFLAKTYEYKGDERFAFTTAEFLKQVIAANDGLTESQKNIFLSERLMYQRELQNVQQTGAIARSGRSGA